MLDKIKELSKDTAIYGISTMVGRFLGFLLVPFYTNVFTTSEYGIFTYLYTILAFLNIVYIYGMDASFLKYSSLAKEEEKSDVISTPLLFVFITSLAFSFLFYSFRFDVSELLDVPSQFQYLTVYIILILFFDTLALIPFANLRLKRKASKFAFIKVGNILINLVLNLYLILVLDFGIEAVFISNLAASAFSLLALVPDIIKIVRIKINKETLKIMLKFGLPYLPANIASMMVQMIDVPILRGMTDDATVGIYRANYKLGIFMMLFVSMFQYAWQPFFLNYAKDKEAKKMFSKVFTLFVLAASVIWLFVSLFIENLAAIEFWNGKTLIGKSFLDGIIIVPIVLFAYIFHGMFVNFTAGIYIEEKTKYFPYVTITGALVNIGVNFLLIPQYGYIGAALATLASYMVMALFLFYFSQKFYRIDYEYGKVGALLLMITVTGSFYYYLMANGEVVLTTKLIIAGVFLIFIFLFKIVKISEVKLLANNILGNK